jgi:3-O-methylgallate 3,4-dioxygenase
MAEIVLGIGTSHGPMLVTDPEVWATRIPADKAAKHPWRRRTWTFDELVEARRDEGLAKQITLEALTARQARSQAAIERLADQFEAARPDVAVIIGNDQMEVFDDRMVPAFAVYCGGTIRNHELPAEVMAKLPVGIDISMKGYIPPGGAEYSGLPPLGEAIVRQAVADDFDVTILRDFPKPQTPHAFGFVYRRIMRDRPVPSVPVFVNTFYPPNTPSAGRCYAFGKSILRAVQSWHSGMRVAVLASGGLTHFVIDEQLDQLFLDALCERDIERVAELGEEIFLDGTSEIKNWLPLAGMMADVGLTPEVIDYVPCYRSEAGTGNAMGFVQWR